MSAQPIRHIIAGSGKVKYVFSGNYHAGAECVSDSVRYITLPSMTECSEKKFLFLISESI